MNGFVSTVEMQLDALGKEIAPAIPKLRAACEYLVANFDRFDINPEIYTGLPEDLARLLERLREHPTGE